jgi:deoxyguanosine kinase
LARHPYIAIEGVIGVGKTTLARLMKNSFQADLLLEVFEENPFLSDFYADRARYAFQTQIFFLLSRYRQQHHVIGPTLARSPLISDYTFAKDRLFAHLNLDGDELTMYDRVHDVLAEKIPRPDLIVFLRARVDTLMERIAMRDRSFERAMSRDYITDLARAYDEFAATYHEAPVLIIDTDDLNWVTDPQALTYVAGQVRAALGNGHEQEELPLFESGPSSGEPAIPLTARRRLTDFQRWQQTLHKSETNLPDLSFHYIGLTQEVGQLGAEMTAIWHEQKTLLDKVGNQTEALDRALTERLPHLRAELADCLSYLLTLANQVGIDLESAYLEKINHRS